jgi:hypothetical protein
MMLSGEKVARIAQGIGPKPSEKKASEDPYYWYLFRAA